ncbi:hypothetical protein ACF0H5_024098 [Mactra antiquata]
MSSFILFVLVVCGIEKGIAQRLDCKTNCACCLSNPEDESRDLTDICSYDYNTNTQNRCTYGCKDGYFGGRCWEICPVYCTMCAREFRNYATYDYEICYLCADGYYNGTGVTNCSTPCPATCAQNQCDKTTGNCLRGCTSYNWSGDKCNVCADTWYGSNCTSPCPTKCTDRKCDSNGDCATGCADDNFTGPQCDQCRVGQYGDNCHINCPENCKNELCDRDNGKCIHGCEGNFVGNRCDMCVTHYYGINCKEECHNCLNGICDRSNGLCNGCDIGSFGDFCDKPCSLGCKNSACDRHDAICSTGCNHGYSGDKCCVLNDNCVKCASTAACAQCKLGHYGDSCSFKCPQNCDGGCDKDSASCYRCANGYFGQSCTQSCSTNCYESECLMTGGACLSCKNGRYGPNCNNTCPANCVNEICDREDGMCLVYHVAWIVLLIVKIAYVIKTQGHVNWATISTSERQTNIIIGGMIGGFILIMIINQVQWFILRRMSRRKSAEQNYMTPNRSKPDEENDEGTYDNPDMYNDGEL